MCDLKFETITVIGIRIFSHQWVITWQESFGQNPRNASDGSKPMNWPRPSMKC